MKLVSTHVLLQAVPPIATVLPVVNAKNRGDGYLSFCAYGSGETTMLLRLCVLPCVSGLLR